MGRHRAIRPPVVALLAVALAVCQHLGVARGIALRGMRTAEPDPGALRRYVVREGHREMQFVNAFAAFSNEVSGRLWVSYCRFSELPARTDRHGKPACGCFALAICFWFRAILLSASVSR